MPGQEWGDDLIGSERWDRSVTLGANSGKPMCHRCRRRLKVLNKKTGFLEFYTYVILLKQH